MRTSERAVAEILGENYDGCSKLRPYMSSANVMVTRMNTCATARGYTLTTEELELIERWLSAHFYTKMDPVYTSKSTLSASGSFMRGELEPYKDAAMALDPSGCLKGQLDQKIARGFWAGKVPSEQIPYDQRD